ncbi:MAG: M67 family metallopeptidase [Pseudomonadota bacterium]
MMISPEDMVGPWSMNIEVTSEAKTAMEEASHAVYPCEACGLLLGRAGRIEIVRPTRNVHATPQTHFEIDPQALIDAHRAEREGGPKVIGYFHSHPTGDPSPSQTDRAMSAGDGKIWAILARGELRLWRDEAGGFSALSYSVTAR